MTGGHHMVTLHIFSCLSSLLHAPLFVHGLPSGGVALGRPQPHCAACLLIGAPHSLRPALHEVFSQLLDQGVGEPWGRVSLA